MTLTLEVNDDVYDLDGWTLVARPGAPVRLQLALGRGLMIYDLVWGLARWTLVLRDCAAAHVDPEVLDADARVRAQLALPLPCPGPPLWRGGLPLDLQRAALDVGPHGARLSLVTGDAPPLILDRDGWREEGRAVDVEAGFRVQAGRGPARWRRVP